MNRADLANQVIEQADIVEIVGEVVSLKPKGNDFWGLCPFHPDKNPSMSVTRKLKIFKCFSCGTGGNVIQFYSKYNNISYSQATVELAKKIGIEVSEGFSKDAENKTRLYKIMKEANNFYRFYLNNSVESKEAYEYLNNRYINKDIIEEFEIGLAPNSANSLNSVLKEQNILDIDQIELGLVNQNNNGIYDIFRQRIMFPIHDHNGNVVGFSGRIYQKSSKDESKYVNSKETPIFHKGNILYNFHKASRIARGLDCIYLFEGFMDVIAAYKANVRNAIATMGTALTNEHARSILSVTNNIVLCFDGDSAGIKALIRSVSVFSDFNIIPKAIILPDNLDPDEFLNKYGKDSLNKKLIESPKNAYDVLYEYYLASLNKNDINSIENFKKCIFNFLSFVHLETSVDFYLKKIADELNISNELIAKDFRKYNRGSYKHRDNNINEISQSNRKTTRNEKNTIKKKYYKSFNQIIGSILNSSFFMNKYDAEMGNKREYFGIIDFQAYCGIINELRNYYKQIGADEQKFMCIRHTDLKNVFQDENSSEYKICNDIMNNSKTYDDYRSELAFKDNIDQIKTLINEYNMKNREKYFNNSSIDQVNMKIENGRKIKTIKKTNKEE